jgi:hypothetical protein
MSARRQARQAAARRRAGDVWEVMRFDALLDDPTAILVN